MAIYNTNNLLGGTLSNRLSRKSRGTMSPRAKAMRSKSPRGRAMAKMSPSQIRALRARSPRTRGMR